MDDKTIAIEKYVKDHGSISIMPSLQVQIDVVKLTRWSRKLSTPSVSWGRWGDLYVRYTDSGVLTISVLPI